MTRKSARRSEKAGQRRQRRWRGVFLETLERRNPAGCLLPVAPVNGLAAHGVLPSILVEQSSSAGSVDARGDSGGGSQVTAARFSTATVSSLPVLSAEPTRADSRTGGGGESAEDWWWRTQSGSGADEFLGFAGVRSPGTRPRCSRCSQAGRTEAAPAADCLGRRWRRWQRTTGWPGAYVRSRQLRPVNGAEHRWRRLGVFRCFAPVRSAPAGGARPACREC